MTENEAIKELKEDIALYDNEITRLDTSIGTPDRNLIDALEMAIQALEKQIPKKPDIEGDGYDPDGNLVYDTWICPTCGVSYEIDYDKYDYCPACGQSIDQSEGDLNV